jgi:hypothetical protein
MTVFHDVLLRILMLVKTVLKVKARIMNLETDLLHGVLKEKIFMDTPPEMKADKDDCLTLKKTIYVSVQITRQSSVMLVEELKGKILCKEDNEMPTYVSRIHPIGLL